MPISEEHTDVARAESLVATPDGTMMDAIVGGSFSGNVHLQMQRAGSSLWHTVISKQSGFSDVVASPDNTVSYRYVVTNIKGTVEIYLGPATVTP